MEDELEKELEQNLIPSSEISGLDDQQLGLRSSTFSTCTKTLLVILSVGINLLFTLLYLGGNGTAKLKDSSPNAGLVDGVVEKQYWHFTAYSHDNETYRDELWNNIDVDRVHVAIDLDRAAALGLPPTKTFPWDESKGVYSIEAYHQLHCLKLLYNTFQEAHRGHPFNEEGYKHVLHCLDSFRAYVECTADDTLAYFADGPHEHPAQGQTVTCRDFSKLDQWALENHACYTTQKMKSPYYHNQQWRNCPPDSKYSPKMREYFGYADDWVPEFPTYFGPEFTADDGPYIVEDSY